ncbi:MAG: dipeptidase [bacterium]
MPLHRIPVPRRSRVLPFLIGSALFLTMFAHADPPAFFVADGHNDVLSRVVGGMDLMTTPPARQTNLQRMKAGGLGLQVFSVWVDVEEYKGNDAVRRTFDMIAALREQCEKHPDQLVMCSTAADVDRARAEGKLAALIGIEGGISIDNDPRLLTVYRALGTRYMTLTWRGDLDWAGSSQPVRDGGPWAVADDHGEDADTTATRAAAANHPPTGKGLNELGRQIVKRCNELGILVDLSHVSDQTFYDALAVSTKPVIISHSCCRALSDHPRNVTDDLLRALANNGGVMGINFYSEYVDAQSIYKRDEVQRKLDPQIRDLRKDFPNDEVAYRKAWNRLIDKELPNVAHPDMDTIVAQIDHVVKIAGVDHVGLGSDYDGMRDPAFGLEDPSKYQDLAKALLAHGYSKEDVKKIMGENFLRILRESDRH